MSIEEGQTISQPFIVAYMAEALELRQGDRVLEVGDKRKRLVRVAQDELLQTETVGSAKHPVRALAWVRELGGLRQEIHLTIE